MKTHALSLVTASLASLPVASSQSLDTQDLLTTRDSLRTDLMVVDLDDDGDLDFLTASRGGGRVGWIEATGPASHGVFHTIDVGVRAEGISAADLDGDGRLDVLVARAGGDFRDPLVWYRNLGRDAFAPAVAIDADGRSHGVVAADVDADGDLDVLHGDFDHGATFCENLGGAQFAPPVSLGQGGGFVIGLAVDDFDGDGNVDVVWASTGFRRIYLATGGGDGTFASAVAVTGALSGYLALTTADLDDDGDTDLVAGLGSALAWIENLGGGAFGAPTTIEDTFTQFTLLRLGAGDLDADGDTDLVTAGGHGTSLVWYENLGAASFAASSVVSDVTFYPFRIPVVDLDGDGDDDAVLASRHVEWIPNLGGGAFGVRRESTRDIVGRPFDVDLDGDLDLLGAVDDTVTLAGNLGDGTFGRPLPLASGLDQVAAAAALDIDADGDQDLVVASLRDQDTVVVRSLERTAAGLAPPVLLYTAPSRDPIDLRLADMDGDGDPDLALDHERRTSFYELSVVWLRNDGPAGLAVQPPSTLFSSIEGGLWADVDGDGDADLVDLRPGAGQRQLVLNRNHGDGTFAAQEVLASSNLGGLRHIAVGDLDGDADLDVVYEHGFTPEAWWNENLGGGVFAPRSQIGPLPSSFVAITTLDVDLDGDDDTLLVGVDGTYTIESLGAGQFGAVVPQGQPRHHTFARELHVADLDGDLDLDVLEQGSGTQALVRNGHRIGVGYCGPAIANSTGAAAWISASGSTFVGDNDVTLLASGLPPATFGYFLVADRGDVIVVPGGSNGQLCLGGQIGRLNRGPAEIFQASGAGAAGVALDLTDVPTPTGAVSVSAGTTHYFQAWFRDANPLPTSNFTNGLRLELE